MATDAQGTRPVSRADESVRVEPTPTSAANPSGVDGVAVYDRGPDGATSSSMHSMDSLRQDPAPVETRSSNTLAWIIGIVVLVILVYFLWQFLF